MIGADLTFWVYQAFIVLPLAFCRCLGLAGRFCTLWRQEEKSVTFICLPKEPTICRKLRSSNLPPANGLLISLNRLEHPLWRTRCARCCNSTEACTRRICPKWRRWTPQRPTKRYGWSRYRFLASDFPPFLSLDWKTLQSRYRPLWARDGWPLLSSQAPMGWARSSPECGFRTRSCNVLFFSSCLCSKSLHPR